MSNFTIKNIKEVEDAAPKFGMPPGIEARFGRRELEGENLGASYIRLDPDFRMPFGHKHDEQEELYVLVGGSGRIKIDDDVHELKQWDAVRLAPGTMRNIEAGPDGLELIAFGAGPRDPGEIVQDWWRD